MFVEQLIKKERRMHEFGFVEERGIFYLLVDCPLFLSLFLLIS